MIKKRTPMMTSVSLNMPEVFDLLIDRSNINLCDMIGQTALHIACKVKNSYAVKKILKKNSNTSAIDNHGRTSLHLAVIEHSIEIVQILLNCAEVLIKDIDGKVPLELAIKNCNTNIEKLLRKEVL